MDKPSTIIIDLGQQQTIDVRALPATSSGAASLIQVRRVGSFLLLPDWFSIGMDKVPPVVDALDHAKKESGFRRDIPWYGERNVLRVWRWPAKPNAGEIVLLEIHREKSDGTYEFTGFKGARLEIPLPYVGKVRSAIWDFWRNMGGRFPSEYS